MPPYPDDVLAHPRRPRRSVPEHPADRGLVVETSDAGFCGAIVELGRAVVAGERRDPLTLEDRYGRRRAFPLLPAGFLLDGALVTLIRPPLAAARPAAVARTASGSFAGPVARARVARASRIWVEGVHDAALVERIWGDDLRVEGVVVEPLSGIDDLVAAVATFAPSPTRRVGVLVDHLVVGSKESRIAADVRNPNVLIAGHPYIDIWQAVTPRALGIDAWPVIARGVNWKDGVCAALGVSDPQTMWRRVLGAVDSIRDVEVPLRRSVEELLDFVTN